MKKTIRHIAFPCFLIANLLFSQVVINLLHDNHDFQKPVVELQKGQSSVQAHTEHCKICALDILFHLFIDPSFRLNTLPPEVSLSVPLSVDVTRWSASLSRGRAPPVSMD